IVSRFICHLLIKIENMPSPALERSLVSPSVRFQRHWLSSESGSEAWNHSCLAEDFVLYCAALLASAQPCPSIDRFVLPLLDAVLPTTLLGHTTRMPNLPLNRDVLPLAVLMEASMPSA